MYRLRTVGISESIGPGLLKGIELGILTGSGMGILNNGFVGWSIYRSAGHDRFAPFVLGRRVLMGLEIGPRGFRETDVEVGMLVAAFPPVRRLLAYG
jgi:hypothetical protein